MALPDLQKPLGGQNLALPLIISVMRMCAVRQQEEEGLLGGWEDGSVDVVLGNEGFLFVMIFKNIF